MAFNTKYGVVVVTKTRYTNNALAIQLRSAEDDCAIAMLSVNLPGSEQLPADCFWAKTWSENREIARQALASGEFTDMHINAAVGACVAQLWKLKAAHVQ